MILFLNFFLMVLFDFLRFPILSLFAFLVKLNWIAFILKISAVFQQNLSTVRFLYLILYFYFVSFTVGIPISEEYFVGSGLFIFFQYTYAQVSLFLAAYLSSEVEEYWYLFTRQYLYVFLNSYLVRYFALINFSAEISIFLGQLRSYISINLLPSFIINNFVFESDALASISFQATLLENYFALVR